jgi:hypothetical protein
MSGGDEAGGCLTISAERPAAAKGDSGGHDAGKGWAWGLRRVTSGAAGATHKAFFSKRSLSILLCCFKEYMEAKPVYVICSLGKSYLHVDAHEMTRSKPGGSYPLVTPWQRPPFLPPSLLPRSSL